jgi:hypothetical protein
MNSPSEVLLAQGTVTSDLIAQTVQSVETLSKDSAFSLVAELMESDGFNNFKLGGVLAKIYSESEWLGDYPKFKDMLEVEFPGIKYRKAMYLIDIYTNLVNAKISWSKVGHLGWTKLKELAAILTQENVDEWVQKAEGLTVLQLIEAIKLYKLAQAGGVADIESDEEIKKLTTMTFKVYEDQKETVKEALDKAKLESGTEFDNVAIESICMNYLSGAVAAKSSGGEGESLADKIKDTGFQDSILLISTLFPQFDITVIEK